MAVVKIEAMVTIELPGVHDELIVNSITYKSIGDNPRLFPEELSKEIRENAEKLQVNLTKGFGD